MARIMPSEEMKKRRFIPRQILIQVGNPLDFSKGMPPSLTVCNTDSLVNDGKYELAASLLESSGGRFAHGESLRKTAARTATNDLGNV
jgi:hypothetical protein